MHCEQMTSNICETAKIPVLKGKRGKFQPRNCKLFSLAQLNKEKKERKRSVEAGCAAMKPSSRHPWTSPLPFPYSPPPPCTLLPPLLPHHSPVGVSTTLRRSPTQNDLNPPTQTCIQPDSQKQLDWLPWTYTLTLAEKCTFRNTHRHTHFLDRFHAPKPNTNL